MTRRLAAADCPSALVLALLLAACPGSSGPLPPPPDETITVSGRVVDFETCLSVAGCAAAPDLRVSLLADSSVVSERTGQDGAFSLTGVPKNSEHLLIVSDATGAQRFLPTLQAEALVAGSDDLFGIELFALQATGGLYVAVVDEAGMRIESGGMYLGQVVAIVDGKMEAIDGVKPAVDPDPEHVRFVRDNPRFNPGETALFDAGHEVTGVFGQFIVVASPEPRSYTISTTASGYQPTSLTARLAAGHLTIGIHRVREAAP